MERRGTLLGLPLYVSPHSPKEGFCVVTVVTDKPGDAHYHVVAVGPGGVTEQRYSVSEVLALAAVAPRPEEKPAEPAPAEKPPTPKFPQVESAGLKGAAILGKEQLTRVTPKKSPHGGA